MPAPKDPEKYKIWKEKLKNRKTWNKGLKVSEMPEYRDSIERMREKRKGQVLRTGPLSEETKKKISESLKGKMKGQRVGFANGHKHSEETKKKMSEMRKGKPGHPNSEETRQKMSVSIKAKFANDKEYAEKVKTSITKAMQNPEVRIKLSNSIKHFYETEEGVEFKKRLSEVIIIRQTGGTLSESHKKAISDANKIYFNQSEIKEELSARSKAMWEDPEYKSHMLDILNDPVVTAKKSESLKIMWANRTDEEIAAISKTSSATMQRRWNDEEERAKLVAINASEENKRHKSEGQIKLWRENTEYRNRMLGILTSNNKRYVAGIHISEKAVGIIHYRSSYELAAYKQLDASEDVVSYESEPFSIPYEFEGVIRNYIPDVLITYVDETKILVEIKPKLLLDDPQNLAKFSAAKAIYGDNFQVWTENEINL